MKHSPFSNLHAVNCGCRDCATPRELRVVRLQGAALLAAAIGFFAYAIVNAGNIATAFGGGF